jgi:hypothetical protein
MQPPPGVQRPRSLDPSGASTIGQRAGRVLGDLLAELPLELLG